MKYILNLIRFHRCLMVFLGGEPAQYISKTYIDSALLTYYSDYLRAVFDYHQYDYYYLSR